MWGMNSEPAKGVSRKPMKRIYHHCSMLEEAGMWKQVCGDTAERLQADAADLMRAPESFRAGMVFALHEWPCSCEHNLTAVSMNRLAWLGHAGCYLMVGSPEATTRLAWHDLTTPEQDKANEVAARVIRQWERDHGYA